MSIAASLAAQSAIINRSNAEMAAIRASEGMQSLAGSGMSPQAAAQKELQLQMDKERAEVQRAAGQAEEEALKKNNKLNYLA